MNDDIAVTQIAGPNPRVLESFVRAATPLMWAVRPKMLGLARLPARGPNLFVGNHTRMFMADYTVMLLELYRRKGILLWSLGDHFHYKIPVWRQILLQNGTVEGTYANSVDVLRHGNNLVVFPGGAREVTKGKGDDYRLLWQGRSGFARLAIQTQTTVIPFATVGGDDIYDVVVDSDDILATDTGRHLDEMFSRIGLPVANYLPPLVKGVGPTLIPRIQRLYYAFGPPIDPKPFRGLHGDEQSVAEFRDSIETAVESLIAMLLEHRSGDEDRSLLGRIRHGVRDRVSILRGNQ